PGPEREAGDPAGAGVGIVALQPVERRGRIAQLALAAVELALGAPDASEVEPQNGKAPALEGLEQGINDLVVHRPPMLGVGMQHDGDGGARLLAMLIAALDSSCGAVDNDFRHFW